MKMFTTTLFAFLVLHSPRHHFAKCDEPGHSELHFDIQFSPTLLHSISNLGGWNFAPLESTKVHWHESRVVGPDLGPQNYGGSADQWRRQWRMFVKRLVTTMTSVRKEVRSGTDFCFNIWKMKESLICPKCSEHFSKPGLLKCSHS